MLGFTFSTAIQPIRFVSLHSTMYAVSGCPPSDFGGFHDNVTVVAVRSEVSSGPSGAEGGPVEINEAKM